MQLPRWHSGNFRVSVRLPRCCTMVRRTCWLCSWRAEPNPSLLTTTDVVKTPPVVEGVEGVRQAHGGGRSQSIPAGAQPADSAGFPELQEIKKKYNTNINTNPPTYVSVPRTPHPEPTNQPVARSLDR
jgi:hypothetical protein